MDLTPISLIGRVVRLEPLSDRHHPDLCEVGFDSSIWQYMLYGTIDTPDRMMEFIQDLLKRARQGADMPFAVISAQTGKAIGCTRYMDIQPHNRGLEIGGTWYGKVYQRTRVNTECKYLLLEHAFDRLGCIRVQFKTDLRNMQSQKALERIGAVREGVLRDHMIRPDGTVRSSVYYSILMNEWPGIRERLKGYLANNSMPV